MKLKYAKMCLLIAASVLIAPMGHRYLSASGLLSHDDNEEILPVTFEAGSVKTRVIDVKGKIRSPLSEKEYVTIGDSRFEVLSPWCGNRIVTNVDPAELEFAKLPPELVEDGRKIYVTATTRDALVEMAAAAAVDGVKLQVDSGYRSASYQRSIYLRKMAEGDDFYEIARGVAPPGYSEHMLGTVVDFVPSKWTFTDTPADKWMKKNGADFGFVQTYPQKSNRGFTWEPWHWKYVGFEQSST